jgi:hypothetical protein
LSRVGPGDEQRAPEAASDDDAPEPIVNPQPEATAEYWTAARKAAAKPMRRTRDAEEHDPADHT